MASRSKKRRRVLGASCILAALIIAGSSFAWFTAKDEVTNRLSANADYDVKIVESFAPPANWLPGDTVKKEVYNVNTGSVAAFVKDTVTSKITIAQEERIDNIHKTANYRNVVKLTPAERYAVEAGSYLAFFKPAVAGTVSNIPLGTQVVSMQVTDPTSLEGYEADTLTTDFAPDVNGYYVFRRVITVNGDGNDRQIRLNNDIKFRTEDFEYAAYYYENGQFYKTGILSVTADDEQDIANDGVATDGILSAASFTNYILVNKVLTPTLTYDAGAHELIATVDGFKYKLDDDELVALGHAYDEAAHDYEEALAAQENAANNLSSLTNAEKRALADYINALKEESKKKLIYDNEKANYVSLKAQYDDASQLLEKTTDDRDNAKEALYGEKDVLTAPLDYSLNETQWNTFITNYTDAGLYRDYLNATYTYEKANKDDEDAFLEELTTYCNDNNISIQGCNTIVAIADRLTLEQMQNFAADPELHEQYEDYINYLIAKKAYDTKLAEYNSLDASVTELEGQVDALDEAVKASLNALYGDEETDPAAEEVKVADPTAPTEEEIAALGDGYFKDWMQAVKDVNDKKAAYEAAEEAVINADDGAKKAYEDAKAAAVDAKAARDKAMLEYNLAVSDFKNYGDIIIHIELENDVIAGGVADKWQLLPTKLENNTAVFYYTSILKGGETTSKLIKAVKLDDSVTKEMYKSFDFDLDIALDSVQVARTADDTQYSAAPTVTELGATATLSDPSTLDSAVAWSANP